MAKIPVDLMAEEFREGSVVYFTIPGPGVCISVKTDRSEVEIATFPRRFTNNLWRT
jgi:hypothetical protein